jgi:hypothetical protein
MATTTACIDAPRPDAARDTARFLDDLRTIVGRRHMLTRPERTRRYRTGFRFGTGPALAVVRPGNLVEQWRVLKACATANKIIIMQAANTGLTGGSTPDAAITIGRSPRKHAERGQDPPHQRRTSGDLPSRCNFIPARERAQTTGARPPFRHWIIVYRSLGIRRHLQ